MRVKFQHSSANSVPVVKIKLYSFFINSKKGNYWYSFLFIMDQFCVTVLLLQAIYKDQPQHLIFQG